MNRITACFRALRLRRAKAFVAFITAGYPSLKETEKLLFEFERSGVDIVELGVPFTDPMADGPVIQEASLHALGHGVTLGKIIAMVAGCRRKGLAMPVCLMTYYNPVFCYGEGRFVKDCVAAGVDGVIIPDLPPEEAAALRRVSTAAGFATVFFVSPTSPLSRVRMAVKAATGFIYYVSLTGVTGERRALPRDIASNIRGIKKLTRTPVCCGFGVSTPGQVQEVWKVADGVIVGSAIVRKIKEHIGSPSMARKVAAFVNNLKGVKRV